MGAQGSLANGTDDLVPHRDSKGQAVVHWETAKRLGEAGRSRIAELEAELADAQHRCTQKEDELVQTQRLLAKLEGAIEKQAKDSELEQDRLSRMEVAFAQQSNGTEEKVAKLLLAVAGEKHRAEVLEKALEEARETSGAEWKETVDQLRKKLSDEEALLKSAMEHMKEKDTLIQELRQKCANYQDELDELRRKQALASAPDAEAGQMLRELQQQLTEEVAKRMDVQNRLLEKDRQLRESREDLTKATSAQGNTSAESRVTMLQYQQRLVDEEGKRLQAEGKLLEKDVQIQCLQQQLADELNSRMEAQTQVAEKERKLSELQLFIEGDDLSRQQGQQAQVIEKEREVCELQQQLADELSRRQSIQYQLIEKERQVCALQSQLMGAAPVSGARMLELPTHLEVSYEQDEPDDEKEPQFERQPKDTEVAAPDASTAMQGRILFDSVDNSAAINVVTDTVFRRQSLGPSSSYQPAVGPTFVAPASSRGGSWSTAAPVRPPISGLSTTPQTIYRASMGAANPVAFAQNYSPPASGGETPVPRVSEVGGASLRNRRYAPQGEPPVETRVGEAAGASLRNRMYVQGNFAMTSAARSPSPPTSDRHQRRLVLASRTYT
uniref:Uncharacterized protein n=1 Tax=Alexandrium monilatum TaxID=311494 RepID=A0A7S4RYK0_9DINO